MGLVDTISLRLMLLCAILFVWLVLSGADRLTPEEAQLPAAIQSLVLLPVPVAPAHQVPVTIHQLLQHYWKPSQPASGATTAF